MQSSNQLDWQKLLWQLLWGPWAWGLIMGVLEAQTPLKLEEEGVKGLEEWFLKEVTTNLAQKWRKWVPEGCTCASLWSNRGPGRQANRGPVTENLDFVLYVEGNHQKNLSKEIMRKATSKWPTNCLKTAFPLHIGLTVKSIWHLKPIQVQLIQYLTPSFIK